MFRRRTKLLLDGDPSGMSDQAQVDGLVEAWARGVLRQVPGAARTPQGAAGAMLGDIEVLVGRRPTSLGQLDAWLERHMATAAPEVLSIVADGVPARAFVAQQGTFAPALLAAEAAIVLARAQDPNAAGRSAADLLDDIGSLDAGAQWLVQLARVRRAGAIARPGDARAASSPGASAVPGRAGLFVHASGYPVVALHRVEARFLRERAWKVPGSIVRYPGGHFHLEVVSYDEGTDRVQVKEVSDGRLLRLETVDRAALERSVVESEQWWHGGSTAMTEWTAELGPVERATRSSPSRLGDPSRGASRGRPGTLS